MADENGVTIFERTELLLGAEAMNKLKTSRVAVFGLGGVGGSCVEALVRSGIGTLDIIDNDKVSVSNINRQAVSFQSTVGLNKTKAMEKLIQDINPDCKVNSYDMFFLPENSSHIDFSVFDYVVDAIDTVSGKIEIIMKAKNVCVPVISCMGTGNKLDPTRLEIADIFDTSVCPLARVMRREMKKRNVKELTVLYSKEEPLKPFGELPGDGRRRAIPGSVSFVPPVAGYIIASYVVRSLITEK